MHAQMSYVANAVPYIKSARYTMIDEGAEKSRKKIYLHVKYSKNQKIVPSSTRKEGCRNAGLQGQGHPCRCIYLNRVASTRDHL